MKTILITLLIIIAGLSNIVHAQSTINEITVKFFTLYETSPKDAVNYAFGTNKWILDRKKDDIANVNTQLTSIIGLIGDYYGYEKIAEKSVGYSYVLISYLVRYDRQPLRFSFVFYKPNDKWQVQNFQFDDAMDDELEEAGKVYRLEENR